MQHNFSISQSAEKEIKKILDSESSESRCFRVKVKVGGCSGFEYVFDYKAEPESGDIEVTLSNNCKVLIDDASITLLENSTLDFEEDLSGARFLVKNPNATAKCGCGNSFAI